MHRTGHPHQNATLYTTISFSKFDIILRVEKRITSRKRKENKVYSVFSKGRRAVSYLRICREHIERVASAVHLPKPASS
jgi:hypothetical protein